MGEGLNRKSGATLVELLIVVVIMMLLFGAVLSTISQGFIAINQNCNKTHAQEANRIALEQTAALIRSSIDKQPSIVNGNNSAIKLHRLITGKTEPQEITIQQPEKDSHIVASGDLNKTLGYDINEKNKIHFTITDASKVLDMHYDTYRDVGYVEIENHTGREQVFSSLTTAASPRVSHVGQGIYAYLQLTTDKTELPNYGTDTTANLTVTPYIFGASSVDIKINESYGGSTTMLSSWAGVENKKKETTPFNALGKPTGSYIFTSEGVIKASDHPKIISNSVTVVVYTTCTDCKGVVHTSVDAIAQCMAVQCSCTKTDCAGSPAGDHTVTISSTDGTDKSCELAQQEADKYFCATTYDCYGNKHFVKDATSLGDVQNRADADARKVQCDYTFWLTALDLTSAHDDQMTSSINYITYGTAVTDADSFIAAYVPSRIWSTEKLKVSSSSYSLYGYNFLYNYNNYYDLGLWDDSERPDAHKHASYSGYTQAQETSTLWIINSTHKKTATHNLYANGKYTFNFDYFCYSPIILDLSGSGVPDVADGDWLPHPDRFDRNRAKQFDMTGEGYFMLTEWVGPQSGLLVTLDENSTVVSALNLFGTAGGWRDGYVKLAALFDKDKNGIVEGNELDGLYVWQDMNMNAKIDPGELKTVKELGITKIWTKHDHYRSLYERNGKKLFTWDWWPSAIDIQKEDRNQLMKGHDMRKHQFKSNPINTNS